MYQRKDKTWQDQLPIPGTKKYKYFYGKTKAEVKAKMAAWQAEQDNTLTMSLAIEPWLESKEKTVKYKTLEGYKAPIARIKETFGDIRIEEITPAQIQAFINDLAAKGYKRTTVQRPLDVMRMVFDYHITRPGSAIKYNPCAGVRLPSGLKQEARELASREDIELVRKGLSLPFGLYAYLLMYTGLRDNEALALCDTDFDFKNDIIHIRKNVSWQPNKPVISTPKTVNGIRTIPLLSQLKGALPKWKGYLFSANGGVTPLTQTEFRKRWNGYCRKAGLADSHVEEHIGKNKHKYKKTVWENRIVPYQLRHEFATICFDAGLDPKAVADIMGHADEEMARRIYTHIKNTRRQKDSKKLQDFVNSQSFL